MSVLPEISTQDRSVELAKYRQYPPYAQLILLWGLSFIVGAAIAVTALKVGVVKTMIALSLAITLPLGWISFLIAIRKIVAVILLPKMVAAFGSILLTTIVITGVSAIIAMDLTLFGIEPWIYLLFGVAIVLTLFTQTLIQPTLRGTSIFVARALVGAIAGAVAVASLGTTNIDRILVGVTTGTLVGGVASLLLDSILKKFTKRAYSKNHAIFTVLSTVTGGLLLGVALIVWR
jgi:hypothetical protein